MTQAARRFYKSANAVERDGAFGVALDERVLRTPKGAPFQVRTRALAEAVAAEWDAQSEHIIPARMPLTQLAFAAIDIAASHRAELARTIAQYVETDLVAHRAEAPASLAARQAAAWDPIVDWGHARFQFRLPVVVGVLPASVSAQNRTEIEWEVDDLDAFHVIALAQAVTLAGSALIGFALLEGHLDAASAYAAATIDDEYALERWGEDAEARARLDRVRAEFDALGRFVRALRP